MIDVTHKWLQYLNVTDAKTIDLYEPHVSISQLIVGAKTSFRCEWMCRVNSTSLAAVRTTGF